LEPRLANRERSLLRATKTIGGHPLVRDDLNGFAHGSAKPLSFPLIARPSPVRFRLEIAVFSRFTVSIVALILVVPIAAAIARPTWVCTIGLDVWNVAALREQMKNSAMRYRELDAEGGEVLQRLAAKDDLVANLIAGRSTLTATTLQFTALNEGCSAYMEVIRDTYPGASDEEKMARNVLDFLSIRLAQEPAWRRLTLLVRLNAEFQTLSAEGAKAATH